MPDEMMPAAMPAVMGKYANGPRLKVLLVGIGVVVTILNGILLAGV